MRRALVLALLAAPLSPQGTLWVVDDDGGAGVDFADLQLAIDTAAEGDAILVRAGDYEDNFIVDGKSLTLIGEPGARLLGPGSLLSGLHVAVLEVKDLSASQRVTVVGLELEQRLLSDLDSAGGLYVEESLGVVWAQGLTVTAAYALRAVSSTHVVAASLAGDSHAPPPLFSIDIKTEGGVDLETATAALYDSDVRGSDGFAGCAHGLSCGDVDAASGAELAGTSSLFVSGCALRGGAGQAGLSEAICGTTLGGGGSDGGDGVSSASGSTAALLATDLVPGVGGPAGEDSFCFDGLPGVPVSGDGTVSTPAGVARSLTATTPVREGETTDITFRGAEGDFVFGLAGPQPLLLDLPGFTGPLTVNAPFVLQPVGTLPAGGEVTLQLTAGELPPGFDFFVRYLQALHVTPAQEIYLGAPTASIVLDDAF